MDIFTFGLGFFIGWLSGIGLALFLMYLYIKKKLSDVGLDLEALTGGRYK